MNDDYAEGYGYVVPGSYGAAVPGGLAGNGLAGGGYDDPSIGGYGAPDFLERGQALARSRGGGRSGRSGRGGTLAVAPPPAFALTPGGGLAMSPWVALGLVAMAVALGVWAERRYKLTSRAEAKVRDEVDDTKRKYVATKRAVRSTARASRKRLADRIYRTVAGSEDDESESEDGR